MRFAEPDKAAPTTSASETNYIHLQLGFLITDGIYCTQICQRSSIFDVTADSPTVEDLSALPGATIQASPTHIELIFTAETEGSLDHTFKLNFHQPPSSSSEPGSSPPSTQLTVRVTALVINRDKGTPSLKPAVKCIGYTQPTDIDLSSP